MGLGVPPLRIKIMLESNPPKSRILVRRLAVGQSTETQPTLNAHEPVDQANRRTEEHANNAKAMPSKADVSLPNAACLMRPRFFHALFIVSRITAICYTSRRF